MSASHKAKGHWGYSSLFGSRGGHKVVFLDHPEVSPVSSQSTGFGSKESQSKSGPAARFRRSGSKVLSLFGIRRNKVSGVGYSSSTTSERDVALAIVRDAAAATATDDSRIKARKGLPPLTIPSSQRVVTPISADGLPFQVPFGATSKTIHPQSPYSLQSAPQGRKEKGRVISLDVSPRRKVGGGLRQSRSMPGLAHQLSHKLSSTFGNPTVVHRPSLKVRPSLASVRDTSAIALTPAVQEAIQPTDSSPSSFTFSGSFSPEGTSTAKTSLESNVASILLKQREGLEKHSAGFSQLDIQKMLERDLPDKSLTPIQELPILVKPTIVTVETTANAKIFFETHFNSILSGQATPRSLRRHELEVNLHSNNLSPEDRHQGRIMWAEQESEYLRQSRVLKAKSRHMTGSKGVSIAGYEVIRILGKGSFGVVRLVREKGTENEEPVAESFAMRLRSRDRTAKVKRDVYAMKVIRKSEMLRNSQEGHLRAERDFLVASEKSRWVVPLIASFQDNTNLYLVMDYMIGGDFLGLLIRYGQLKEKRTRWYLAEMVLCIEEAHRLRWIHRDVKPDNFLISASGHIKISDFGLAFDGHWAHDQTYFNHHRYSLLESLGIKIEGDSIDRAENSKAAPGKKLAKILMGGREARNGKDRHERPPVEERSENESVLQWRNRHGKRKLARSVVGTSQYMAPEVIRGELYDGRCDWWSIGIIMFECLYGWTPFVGEDRQETKAKILNHHHEFHFPPSASTEKKYKVSHEAKDLVNRMLQEKEHRLCSKKYLLNDYEEAKRSPVRSGDPATTSDVQDFQGHFVFPDDATDIKAHPFFQGIPWDRLHLTRAPEVPDVKSRYDTKYFDEEEPISDVDDASSTSSVQEQELKAQEAYEEGIAAAYNAALAGQGNMDGAQNANEAIRAEVAKQDVAIAVGEADLAGKQGEKVKEKKRPRDRILRDTAVAKQVLDLRKKGAFLGYTYRRPRPVLMSIENGRPMAESLTRRRRLPGFNSSRLS
ncbi:hypothetical protein MMC13_002003 [Lambiella insularis]|nr:hypothetical protein [Lambiella insularis]